MPEPRSNVSQKKKKFDPSVCSLVQIFLSGHYNHREVLWSESENIKGTFFFIGITSFLDNS